MRRVSQDRPEALDALPLRGEPVVRLDEPVEVEVTVRWSDLVETVHRGSATHHAGSCVHVVLQRSRYGGQAFFWLPAGDVRRL